jgi:hypothetical protein
MPRPPKQILSFDYKSVEKHMQEVYNQLEELRMKAQKDYKKVADLMEGASEIVILEAARYNAMKTFENFFQKKIDLLKIHASIVNQMHKKPVGGAEEKESGATGGAMGVMKMQELYEQLKSGKMGAK